MAGRFSGPNRTACFGKAAGLQEKRLSVAAESNSYLVEKRFRSVGKHPRQLAAGSGHSCRIRQVWYP